MRTEDQSEPVKKSSRSVKPAKKKAKSSSKKSAGPKAQPSKRAPKIRIDHGELVQRADGTFWFRANDTASWGKYESSTKNDYLLIAGQNRQSATSLIARLCWPMLDGIRLISTDQIERMVSAAQKLGP